MLKYDWTIGSAAAATIADARTGSGGLRFATGLLIRIVDGIGVWCERAAQRRQLAALDDRALHDIGLDRATAGTEAAKPAWRR